MQRNKAMALVHADLLLLQTVLACCAPTSRPRYAMMSV